jgi:hypothetical protein
VPFLSRFFAGLGLRRMAEGRKGERRISPKIVLLPFFSRCSIIIASAFKFSAHSPLKPQLHGGQKILPRTGRPQK